LTQLDLDPRVCHSEPGIVRVVGRHSLDLLTRIESDSVDVS
jgi:hypothetical protein